MSERDARRVIIQVLAGLRYLHHQQPAVIHNDLKPANVLFYNSEVKLADFGFSKWMPHDGNELGVEFTSHDRVTTSHSYLAPECQRGSIFFGAVVLFLFFCLPHGSEICFLSIVRQGKTACISTKVDVWGCGIILYYILYNNQPFPNNQQQSTFMMAHAYDIHFPAKPVISQACKAFIQTCLTPEDELRPTIDILFEHPFIKPS